MADKKTKKSDKTRQFIIEKAAPVFNKKGIAGTSISDLTRATGLTKGSIYGNFRDKDEVAVSVFHYNVNNLTRYLSREMDKETAILKKLLAFPRAYGKLYPKMVEYGGCPILNTATEADDTHQVLCDLASRAIDTMKEKLVKLMEEGQNKGEIQKDTDPDKIADITISLIEGAGVLSKVTGKSSYMENALDQVKYIIRSTAGESDSQSH